MNVLYCLAMRNIYVVDQSFSHICTCTFTGTDPEDTLRNAFKMFDADNCGFIAEE